MNNLLKFLLPTLLLASTLNVSGQQFKILKVADGFNKPIDITYTGEINDTRLFITEKDGKIKILKKEGNVLPTPFLDIDGKVNSIANERGLLGLSFDPNYSTNGYFYVNYSNNNGNTTISRFKRSVLNPDLADPTSEKILLVVNQPYNNHNGGCLKFGPDGYLYIGLGDGGAGGDPGNKAQNAKELLGKMLRIDVRTETEKYLIPNDNPYINRTDTLPEIWSMGLRNPWRYSFDKLTGDLWIGDVGQDKWEEIDMEPKGLSGLNYGWRCWEGFQKFNSNGCNADSLYQKPVFVYEHKSDIGCSITGGFVYRGLNNPSLYGKYLYADYCTGIFWSLSQNDNQQWVNVKLADLRDEDFVSFGEDKDGELYVAGAASGIIYKLSDSVSATNEINGPDIEINISENPTSQILSWNLRYYYIGKITWFIMDSQGKTIKSFVTDKSSEKESYTISLDDLGPGTYLLTSDKTEIPVKKIIKTN
ncbi:MAG: PQQ-dependent sugar dehydrogenase [Saprospiraceae bacterium]|nr:PQQ-dependent sugar dehydrogenase [Saprospiraceae bacterium]